MFGTDDLKSLHLLDPEIRPLLDAIRSFKLSSETLAEFRSMEFPAPSPTEAELTVELLHRHVDGAPGSPPVRLAIYRPFGTSAPLPTIRNSQARLAVRPNGNSRLSFFRSAVDVGCMRGLNMSHAGM